MKRKLVMIEYCGDCPHRFYKGNDLFCDKTDKQTTEGDSLTGIPEWCPLSDVPELIKREK
jgi:hypothetical protein